MTANLGGARSAPLPSLLASAVVVLLVGACGATPDIEEGEEVGLATVTEKTDETEPEPDGDATGTDGAERPASSEGGDASENEQETEEEEDPFEEIAWALTPAGPGSPSVNEDSIYKVLDDLDPQACAALLDPVNGWFDPSNFGTGERSVHLFLAGAHLCAGDRANAMASYEQAQQFTWDFAVEQPLHSRVCNVWDAVTRMLDPAAGPCALEELSFDEPADPDDPDGPEDPEDPEDTDGAEDTEDPLAPEEPTGDTTSEPETEGTADADPESAGDASGEPGDESTP